MKQLVFFLAIFFISANAIAQTESTQTPAPPLKDRIVGKWIYKGTEEFAVLTPADSTQKNDYVEITADGNYMMVTNGKEETGAYKLVADYKQIYFTSNSTKKTKMYTVKSSLNGKLVLDFQTPDLIHTKYQYEKAK